MITCYFQYLYCVISPPTQFLQLSPRLVPTIVSMSGYFFLFVCLLLKFRLPSSPLPTFPHFKGEIRKQSALFNSLQVFQQHRVLVERKKTMPEVTEPLPAVAGAKDASPVAGI